MNSLQKHKVSKNMQGNKNYFCILWMMYWSKDISFTCSHNFVQNQEDSKTLYGKLTNQSSPHLKRSYFREKIN